MPEITSRFEIRLAPSLQSAIDDWRAKQPGVPPRAAAARALIEIALAGHAMSSTDELGRVEAAPEVPAVLQRGMPWHSPGAMDHSMQLNVRINARISTQLDWLTKQGDRTKRGIVEEALTECLGRALRRRGVAP